MAKASEAGVSARLWDWPTRLVHWGLAALIAFDWWSAEDHLQWHRWAGYGVIGLLAFRLLWGFVGSRTARFASFVKGPGATLAYLRTLPSRAHADAPGHNPLGALSVLAILGVLVFQVVTGLFAVDIDAFEAGPLSDRVSFDLGRRIAHWHELSFTVLEVLVVLHLAAIAFYFLYKRANLVGAMITGKQRFARDPGLDFAPVWRIAAVALAAAAFAWWASKGFRL